LRVTILGGGVTGLFTAYYLKKASYEISLIERDAVFKEASVYNAGLLTPSFAPTPQLHFGTLLASSIMRRGALYFSLGQVLRYPSWYWTSLRKGLTGFEERTIKLGLASLELYRQFFNVENLDPDVIPGVLGVYVRAEDAKSFTKKFGGRLMGKEELQALGLRQLDGGVDLENEISINPRKLINQLYERISKMGVEVIPGSEATLKREDSHAVVQVNGKTLETDKIVIAAGSWSRQLAVPLKYEARILPASGLAMIFDTGGKTLVERPLLLEDYGIGVTQHNETTLRVTSFFEMVGFNKAYGPARRKWLFDVVRKHVVDLSALKRIDEGIGFRPCTPDQFPLVGAIPGYDNVFIASGNCRLGVTLAPATAFMIKSMFEGESYLDELRPSLSPARFK
jgi:D-amino-acid dehydrogenase